jgi:hypothetical protein
LDQSWCWLAQNRQWKRIQKDAGKLPLDVPQIKDYLCDITHRVKGIGSSCYEVLESNLSKPKIEVVDKAIGKKKLVPKQLTEEEDVEHESK